jgi:general stress protein YciG
MENEVVKKRGFGSMDREKLLAICSRGGKSVAPEKRTFSNHEKAVEAGHKGAKVRIANMWAKKAHLLGRAE